MKVKKPRTKGLPYQIEETFPPPYEDVKIRITGYLPDLCDLYGDYYEDPEKLGKLLLNRFLGQGIWETLAHFGIGTRPRGIHSTTWKFIQNMRIRAPYTFGLMDYWLKRPQEKWPKPISKVIKEFQQDHPNLTRSGKRKESTALEVTAYIMERNFGRERKENNPASSPWTEDSDGFKKIYILRSPLRNWIEVKLKDLESLGTGLPSTLPIVTEKPWEVIESLFPSNHT